MKKWIVIILVFLSVTTVLYIIYNTNQDKMGKDLLMDKRITFRVLDNTKYHNEYLPFVQDSVVKNSKNIAKQLIEQLNKDRKIVLSDNNDFKNRFVNYSSLEFEKAEEFSYIESMKVLNKISVSDYSQMDSITKMKFNEYLLYNKCSFVDSSYWYFLPFYRFSFDFYNNCLPVNYKTLLDESYMEDSSLANQVDILTNNKEIAVVEIDEFLNSENIQGVYYWLSKEFIDKLFTEIESNKHRLEGMNASIQEYRFFKHVLENSMKNNCIIIIDKNFQ